MYSILVTAAIAAVAYYVFIKPFLYWANKGVLQQNVWILWTESVQAFMQTRPLADTLCSFYNKYANQRYAGFYQFVMPALLLRDLDLIKQITVKDFNHFTDHTHFVSEEQEPLFGMNLVALRGDKWKDKRATLTPIFTSSKMRSMFGFMTGCAEQFVRYFDKGDSKTIAVELTDAFTRYSNDVIASSAFGITSDSLKEPENEFYLMGKEAMNFRGFWRNLSLIILFLSPKLSSLLGVHLFSKRVSAFFRKLVKENIESREKNGVVRPDMIHFLMEAGKGRLRHKDNIKGVPDSGLSVIHESSLGKEEKRQKRQFSNDDITAQLIVFFFAGFESISMLLSFTAYELAVNPDVQERLLNEVDETLRNCNGSITYEALLKMKYLDMVISESLRKWPPTLATERVCVKPYTIQPVKHGEKPLLLQQGDVVWLPIYPIQMDPEYYPEPDRFHPDRFSDENKSNIPHQSFLAFGLGPRNCIAYKFALLEAKTIIFYILSKFEIVVIEKTPIPIKISKDQFNLNSESGFWLGLKPRNGDQK